MSSLHKLTRHHLTPRSRKGGSSNNNVLNLRWWKHEAWHRAFRNLTLEEVISLLMSLDEEEAKSIPSHEKIFKNSNSVIVLQRVRSIKKR